MSKDLGSWDLEMAWNILVSPELRLSNQRIYFTDSTRMWCDPSYWVSKWTWTTESSSLWGYSKVTNCLERSQQWPEWKKMGNDKQIQELIALFDIPPAVGLKSLEGPFPNGISGFGTNWIASFREGGCLVGWCFHQDCKLQPFVCLQYNSLPFSVLRFTEYSAITS